MKRVIVTGADGQLGRAINLQYAGSGEYELINTDVGDLDITDIDKVMKFVREIRPYAIINCAAYTAVDACDQCDRPEESEHSSHRDRGEADACLHGLCV